MAYFDENTASSLCYTSGTTGNPKGVLYSHRSTVLHAMLLCMTDGLGIAAVDSILLASPMFHVNAWGVPYGAALSGARLLLPGAALDGASLYQLMRETGHRRRRRADRVAHVAALCANAGAAAADDLALRRVIVGGTAVRHRSSKRSRNISARACCTRGGWQKPRRSLRCAIRCENTSVSIQTQRIHLQRKTGPGAVRRESQHSPMKTAPGSRTTASRPASCPARSLDHLSVFRRGSRIESRRGRVVRYRRHRHH